MQPLRLDPAQTPIVVDIAPALGGATAWDQIETIDLEKLPDMFRRQRVLFLAARKAFESLRERFTGQPDYLIVQLIRLLEHFVDSDLLQVPSLFHQEPLRKRILVALNADLLVQHLLRFVVEQNVERIEPVFDEENPVGSTREMRTWYTTKENIPSRKSQISHVVGDSAWEIHTANILEKSAAVTAYAKNDHLGFSVYYLWNGARRRFVPDFLIRLASGRTLVLEIKGEDDEQNRTKRAALDAWIEAVNTKGGFGEWCADVVFEPSRIEDTLRRWI